MTGRIPCALLVLCLFVAAPLRYAAGEILFVAERLPLKGDRTLSDVPWPYPQQWSRDNSTFTLSPSSLTFRSNLECDVIDDAIRRYRHLLRLLREETTSEAHDMREVEIRIKNQTCEIYPHLDMNEGYELFTEREKVVISCDSEWGALRGLETFSQLLFEENGKVMMKNWTISDRPRFSHRGFMVDTSRHYLPLAIIKKHLDAMTWSKLNVLHWHIVDAQSFPYVSSAFPELSEKGAYTPKHIYKPEDVAEVIEYARLRGIRVIPEFDTPGHAHSWGKGRPELLTPCWSHGQPLTAEYGQHATSENLDPTNPATFTFLWELMQEVTSVFKDQFLHAGLDEAHYMCWESNPNITAFMKEKGFEGNYGQFEQYYVTKALGVIAQTGKDVIVWQDPIDNGVTVKEATIVEVWKNDRDARDCHPAVEDGWQEFARRVAKAGNRLLVSSCWYLNYVCYGEDWRRFYACDPHSFAESSAERDLVVGGEACMWGEYIDGTNFLQRAWPRAAATAERLWSPSHVTDADTAAFRLDAHRCHLVRRGVPAEPVLPGYCGHYDYGFEPQTPEEQHTSISVPSTAGPCQTSAASGVASGVLTPYLVMFLCVACMAILQR